jgi:hypothetical protein
MSIGAKDITVMYNNNGIDLFTLELLLPSWQMEKSRRSM